MLPIKCFPQVTTGQESEGVPSLLIKFWGKVSGKYISHQERKQVKNAILTAS
jgi:hypothetical protein